MMHASGMTKKLLTHSRLHAYIINTLLTVNLNLKSIAILAVEPPYAAIRFQLVYSF